MTVRSLLSMFALLFSCAATFTQNPPEPTSLAKQVAELEARASRQDKALVDWPNLARYRYANAQLSAPAKDQQRVVFMGDSITDAWPDPLNGEFFSGKPYIGRGISGQTTPQMLVRFRPDVIALHPAAVVILAGTNDLAGNTGAMSLEEIEGNLASMCELAQAHRIKVILASVLPVYDGGHNQEGKSLVMTDRRPPEKILGLNQWIRSYAAEHDDVYLDYFSAMADDKGFLKKDLSEDGLHPNKAGYDVMAPLADAAIDKAFRKR
jgi:lysophospholipase L1-like esterase